MSRTRKDEWEEVGVSSGRHLKRMVEMYQELGWEVRLQEVGPDEAGECTACYEAEGEPVYRVYTRSGQRTLS